MPGHRADDDDEFDLPVGVTARRQLDIGERAGDARRVLREDRRRGVGAGEARFGRVGAVVEPDREHLSRVRWRRTERFRLERLGRRQRCRTGPGEELGPPLVDIDRLRTEPTPAGRLDVDGGAARTVDQGDPAVDGGDAHVHSPDADELVVDTAWVPGTRWPMARSRSRSAASAARAAMCWSGRTRRNGWLAAESTRDNGIRFWRARSASVETPGPRARKGPTSENPRPNRS